MSTATQADDRSARRLAREGLFQSLAQGLSESYLSAFALFLGAGGPVLGLVSALPTASTALAQSVAGRLAATRRSLRTLVARAWSSHAAALAAIGLCVLLPPSLAIAGLCLLLLVGWGAAGLAVPAWMTLVSDRVPRERLGWFFGLRGAAQQAGVLVAIVAGGMLLWALRRQDLEGFGFAVLFLAAATARFAGSAMLRGVADSARTAAAPRSRIRDALGSSARFRRLAIYLWLLHLGTHAATPFFVPYMLAELRLSYAQIGLLLAVPAAVKIGTIRFWGRLADRVGPGPLLRLAGWLVVSVPALWVVSGSPWWILACQVFSGLVWGAFEVAQASALLQTTRGRAGAVAAFHHVDGAAILAGSLIGGLVVRFGVPVAGSGYLAAMMASALLRAVPSALLLWRVRGIGRPMWSHLRIPLRLWSVRPTRGMSLRAWGEPPDDEGGPGPTPLSGP